MIINKEKGEKKEKKNNNIWAVALHVDSWQARLGAPNTFPFPEKNYVQIN